MAAKVEPETIPNPTSVTNTYLNGLDADEKIEPDISFHASRMRASEPHKGEILPNPRLKLTDVQPNEEYFIPMELAKEKLEKVVEDMDKMRLNHLKMIQDAQLTFKEIDTNTRNHYTNFIQQVRSDANSRISTHIKTIRMLERDMQEKIKNYTEKVSSLEGQITTITQEKEQMMIENQKTITEIENKYSLQIKDLENDSHNRQKEYEETIIKMKKKKIEDEKMIKNSADKVVEKLKNELYLSMLSDMLNRVSGESAYNRVIEANKKFSATSNNSMKQVNNEFQKSKKAISDLNNMIEKKNKEIEDIKSQLVKKDKDIADIQSKYDKLSSSNDEMTKLIEELSNTKKCVEERDKEIANLKTRISTNNTISVKEERKGDNGEEEEEEKKERSSGGNSGGGDVSLSELKEVEERLNAKENEFKQLQEDFEKIKEENERLKPLENENKINLNKISDLQSIVNTLQSKSDSKDLINDLQEKNNVIQEKESKILILEDEIKQIKEELKEKTNDFETLQNAKNEQINSLASEIEEYKQKIKVLESRPSAAASITTVEESKSSIVPVAVPVVSSSSSSSSDPSEFREKYTQLKRHYESVIQFRERELLRSMTDLMVNKVSSIESNRKSVKENTQYYQLKLQQKQKRIDELTKQKEQLKKERDNIVNEMNQKRLEALESLNDDDDDDDDNEQQEEKKEERIVESKEDKEDDDDAYNALLKTIELLEERLIELQSNNILNEYNEAYNNKVNMTQELKQWKEDYKKENGKEMPKKIMETRKDDFVKIKKWGDAAKKLKNEAENINKEIDQVKNDIKEKREQLEKLKHSGCGGSKKSESKPIPVQSTSNAPVDNSKLKELKISLKAALMKEQEDLNKIRELEDKVNELEQSNSQLKSDYNQLKYDYDNNKQELAVNASVDVSQYTEQIDTLNDKIEDYKHKIEDLESEISELKYELEQAKSNVNTKVKGGPIGKAPSTANGGGGSNNSAEVNKLKRDLENANKKVTDGNEQIVSLKKEVADLKNKLKEAQAKPKAAPGGIDEKRAAEMKKQIKDLTDELEKTKKESKEEISKARKEASESGKTDKEKIKKLEKTVKENETKMRMQEKQINDLQNNTGISKTEVDKMMKEQATLLRQQKEQSQKQIDDIQKELDRTKAIMERDVGNLTKELNQTKENLDTTTKERDEAKKKIVELEAQFKDLDELKEKANKLNELTESNNRLQKEYDDMNAKYKKEVVLRKQLHNKIEDMNGQIRVYCRCRPMAKYEIEKGTVQCVAFPDEYTIEVMTQQGTKQFLFNRVYDMKSTQEEVFEDTYNLIQSAYDGYNVCIFAYGQTGSGKTFTMTGSEEMPGITRRSIKRLFELIKENDGIHIVNLQSYMVEIYNDNLVDLFFRLKNQKNKKAQPPKLKIIKDERNLVKVKDSVILPLHSEEETLKLFNDGNEMRHVGATAMNEGSSRSHLIFSIILEVNNLQTKKTAFGKISFIDLAGSERAGKTGATNERLKEAMSINKSLSALGNVISALSTQEKFIPYRDNLLTQLMQDSLGGDAKTLMFVNISPSDYNCEETCQSLAYAQRVKMIKNNATKDNDSQEIARLKKIIANLRAGGDGNIDDKTVAAEEPPPAE